MEPSKQRKGKEKSNGSWVVCKFRMYWKKDALYRKSYLCLPGNETVQPCSQFLHSCICERLIYSQDPSAYLAAAQLADRSRKYINRSQIYECRNWETEHYNSVFEIMRLRSFITVNTSIGTRHLYWILTGPSL